MDSIRVVDQLLARYPRRIYTSWLDQPQYIFACDFSLGSLEILLAGDWEYLVFLATISLVSFVLGSLAYFFV
jgi:hypothetical protein